jgi:hypothetical protein
MVTALCANQCLPTIRFLIHIPVRHLVDFRAVVLLEGGITFKTNF